MASGPGKWSFVASLWVLTMLAAPQEDNGAPGVLLLLTAGLAAVSALLTALAWIGWRAKRTGAWPPQARRQPPAPDAAPPPDPALEWAAEIEWHRDPGGGSRFCLVASRNGTRERAAVSESEPLGWPPNGPESLDALKHAVEQLEAGAVAAGWRPAPAGRAWYAKRFPWQPVTRVLTATRRPRSRGR
jgi:hypothetical protein